MVGEEVRLSLAGAQDKVAVRMVNDNLALPIDGGPTTHILKAPIEGYADTVANECFCMQLADLLGLPVPAVEQRTFDDIEVLLVERFDRDYDENTGTLRRVHQEDFCQALAKPPDQKYQSEGGPGFVDLFNVLTRPFEAAPPSTACACSRWRCSTT